MRRKSCRGRLGGSCGLGIFGLGGAGRGGDPMRGLEGGEEASWGFGVAVGAAIGGVRLFWRALVLAWLLWSFK